MKVVYHARCVLKFTPIRVISGKVSGRLPLSLNLILKPFVYVIIFSIQYVIYLSLFLVIYHNRFGWRLNLI